MRLIFILPNYLNRGDLHFSGILHSVDW